MPVVYRIKKFFAGDSSIRRCPLPVFTPASCLPRAALPGRAPASRPPPRLHGGESRRRRTGRAGGAVPGPRLPAARCGVVPGISARASGRRSVGRHTEGGRCVADCSDSACTPRRRSTPCHGINCRQVANDADQPYTLFSNSRA